MGETVFPSRASIIRIHPNGRVFSCTDTLVKLERGYTREIGLYASRPLWTAVSDILAGPRENTLLMKTNSQETIFTGSQADLQTRCYQFVTSRGLVGHSSIPTGLKGADSNLSLNNYRTTPDITFQARVIPVEAAFQGTIDWDLDLEYETSGGHGGGGDHRHFQTQNAGTHDDAYTAMGGKVTVTASTHINGRRVDKKRVITVTGTPIPDNSITDRLKGLYDAEEGGTDSICCGIASKESSYMQFYNWTLYGYYRKWPYESDDNPDQGYQGGGIYVGLMQVPTTFGTAWDWCVNTDEGVNIFNEKIGYSHNHVSGIRSQHSGLRDLTSVEHENNAFGIEYADDLRTRSRMY